MSQFDSPAIINGKLTYMSIMDLIVTRVQQGMLFPLYPRAPGASPKRALLIAEELWNFIRAPGPGTWKTGRVH
jgi:hypothetical protein